MLKLARPPGVREWLSAPHHTHVGPMLLLNMTPKEVTIVLLGHLECLGFTVHSIPIKPEEVVASYKGVQASQSKNQQQVILGTHTRSHSLTRDYKL